MTAAPVLALQGIRRRFVQGQAVLDVLQGIDLVLPPRHASRPWSARPAPASRRCCTSPACSSGPAPARSRSRAGPATALGDAERTRLRRERIGFVYQFHHLLPDFTALENVAMPQLIAGRAEREADGARRRALLGRLGLAARLDHRPARLSGGEQQRVAIARALANRPGLILADEPTGNLDPHTAEEVFAILLEVVRDTGTAALIATHNPELAARMDATFRLTEGRVARLPLAA